MLGDPVEHSPSPAMFDAAFQALGVRASYDVMRVAADALEVAMRRLASNGGGNITLPHKRLAADLLDDRSSRVVRTGACNCFWAGEAGSLWGDNTDVGGFVAAARRLSAEAGVRLAGSRALVLGAGGAARAVLDGLGQLGAASVDVLNRTRSRADRLVAEVQVGGVEPRVLSAVHEVAPAYDLVVNATSLGLRGSDPLPLNLSEMEVHAALDSVYGPDGTPWTRHAREVGVEAADGLEMLVEQARLSVRNWLGLEPPPEVLRQAATAALAS